MCLSQLVTFIAVYFFTPADDHMIMVKGNGSLSDFCIDKYEVTLADYHEFVFNTGYVTHDEKRGKGVVIKGFYDEIEGVNWRHDIHGKLIPVEEYKNYPVTRVNYYDALAYAKWKGKSLPTIEQWYYAANEGIVDQKYRYSGSNNLNKVGWFEQNSNEYNQKVGTKAPNAIGLFDMSGNVAEIVVINKEKLRVQYVGGSFFDDKEDAELHYAKSRGGNELVSIEATLLWSKPNHGFRCVKNVREGE